MSSLQKKIRLNTSYRLIEKSHVTGEIGDVVHQITAGHHFGSILLPKSEELNTKLLSEEVTNFLLPFRQALTVNFNAIAQSKRDRLIELILDKVLEVESEKGFKSGPLLYAEMKSFYGQTDKKKSLNRVISLAAIQYAACLNEMNKEELSALLYTYNRIPIHPELSRKNQNTDHLLNTISLPEKFKENWIQKAANPSDYWISFLPKNKPQNQSDNRAVKYKIYLSPFPEQYTEVFSELANQIDNNEVIQFKTAVHSADLLRPDKLVLYLKDEKAYRSCGKRLLAALKGIKGQGNPFTYAFDQNGLISGGVDPDYSESGKLESWRSHICNLLAKHLLVAGNLSPKEKVDYALLRLELQGINTTEWIPKSASNKKS